MVVLLRTVLLPLLIVRPLALKTLHTQSLSHSHLKGMEAKRPVSHSDFKGDGSKDASLTK